MFQQLTVDKVKNQLSLRTAGLSYIINLFNSVQHQLVRHAYESYCLIC